MVLVRQKLPLNYVPKFNSLKNKKIYTFVME